LNLIHADLFRLVMSKASSTGIIRSQDHDDLISIAEELGVDANELSLSDIKEAVIEHGEKVYSGSVSTESGEVSVAIYRVVDPDTNARKYVAILSCSTESDETAEIYATDTLTQAIDLAESFLLNVPNAGREISTIIKELKRRTHSASEEESVHA